MAGHAKWAQHYCGQVLVCSLSLFYKLLILWFLTTSQHCVYTLLEIYIQGAKHLSHPETAI